MPPTLRALPALALLGAIWGLTPAIAKAMVQGGGVAPLGLAALVAALSAALLQAVCALRGLRVPWHGRPWPHGGGVSPAAPSPPSPRRKAARCRR